MPSTEKREYNCDIRIRYLYSCQFCFLFSIGSVIAYSDLNINPTATTNTESLAAAIVKALADGPTVTVGSTSFPVLGVTYKGQTSKFYYFVGVTHILTLNFEKKFFYMKS